MSASKDSDSEGSDSSDSLPLNTRMETRQRQDLHRVAKKSTSVIEIRTTGVSTRRQMNALNKMKSLKISSDKFMENFDPETSVREKRKLTRKINSSYTQTRRIPGALHDESGVHINTGIDMCDCLQTSCSGCHFPCPKCKSQKCGSECRSNRKFIYDQVEFHGCDLIIKNPLTKY